MTSNINPLFNGYGDNDFVRSGNGDLDVLRSRVDFSNYFKRNGVGNLNFVWPINCNFDTNLDLTSDVSDNSDRDRYCHLNIVRPGYGNSNLVRNVLSNFDRVRNLSGDRNFTCDRIRNRYFIRDRNFYSNLIRLGNFNRINLRNWDFARDWTRYINENLFSSVNIDRFLSQNFVIFSNNTRYILGNIDVLVRVTNFRNWNINSNSVRLGNRNLNLTRYGDTYLNGNRNSNLYLTGNRNLTLNNFLDYFALNRNILSDSLTSFRTTYNLSVTIDSLTAAENLIRKTNSSIVALGGEPLINESSIDTLGGKSLINGDTLCTNRLRSSIIKNTTTIHLNSTRLGCSTSCL